MNADNYLLWSEYYDPDNKELEVIDYVLKNYCDIPIPWKLMNVLEVGCGTGRFTKRIIESVAHIDAVDPDLARLSLLDQYLTTNGLSNKCTLFGKTFSQFLKEDQHNSKSKYDLIIFSWSWAYIPDPDKESSVLGSLSLLKEDGAIISTMVEGGKYEEMVFDICSNSNADYRCDLETNAAANEVLRSLLLDKSVYISETLISTDFQFDDLETLKSVVLLSMPQKENISIQEVDNYLRNNPNTITRKGEKYALSDVVRCIIYKPIPPSKKKAKITFNYKLCDNRGDCSAAKECRKYRSAIIRTPDTSKLGKGQTRWAILTDRCDPELCGRKCESVCELFSIYSFWSEVYESLRQIEKTTIEPDFFDKDRYGSGSYNPDHRTTNFDIAVSCLDESKPLQILEISDESRHASSFDSVLITDLISKPYYDRYYIKYEIPKIEEEDPDKVTLYEDAHKYDDIYKMVLDSFRINELPALLFISHGKIIFQYEGLLRNVDVDVVNYLKNRISDILSNLL